ncbi:hypothetical protein SAMN05216266_11741 [Amycolatopsis marina]|uniref:Uncharacterized protein n=1 Tax=Amycolatopsis marina TaxID=490629 RepID=A0A1I1BXP2_9PSEU|nr:hypothetical protein SAMN05216266_11741 [Amycolatopsis marina]
MRRRGGYVGRCGARWRRRLRRCRGRVRAGHGCRCRRLWPMRTAGTGKVPVRASLYAVVRPRPSMRAAVIRSVVTPSSPSRSRDHAGDDTAVVVESGAAERRRSQPCTAISSGKKMVSSAVSAGSRARAETEINAHRAGGTTGRRRGAPEDRRPGEQTVRAVSGLVGERPLLDRAGRRRSRRGAAVWQVLLCVGMAQRPFTRSSETGMSASVDVALRDGIAGVLAPRSATGSAARVGTAAATARRSGTAGRRVSRRAGWRLAGRMVQVGQVVEQEA